MNLIILAAPGAGKGTQAELLSKHFSIPTISTGAILRKNISDGTELGKIAEQYINDGKFVPDDVMIKVVADRLAKDDCKNGFILDGFPRTLSQAKALDDYGIEIDTALSLEVDDDVIVERLSGRRECSVCRTPYHVVSNPPKVDGICDKCSAPLKSREDDVPEIIASRLAVYHKETAPVKEYYEAKGKLKKVMGQNGVENTSKSVLSALGKLI